MATIESQPAFVIHSRPYTDSKRLVDLLTRDHGRVSAVSRDSGKQSGKRKNAFRLQAFSPLLVSWGGKSSLKTLYSAETDPAFPYANLHSKALYCGFYLNEVILRVLPESDACEDIFFLYQHTLADLSSVDPHALAGMEPLLRRFEFGLLAALGFAVDFSVDASDKALREEAFYHHVAAEGFRETLLRGGAIYAGAELLAMARGELSSPSVMMAAKRLSRVLLQPILGDKPLNTKELFR